MTNTSRGDQSARLDIAADGTVKWLAGGSVGFVNLTGISFTRRPGTALSMPSGWGPYESGYRGPNWTEREGIYRIGGLAKRTTGSWSHIATLHVSADQPHPHHAVRPWEAGRAHPCRGTPRRARDVRRGLEGVRLRGPRRHPLPATPGTAAAALHRLDSGGRWRGATSVDRVGDWISLQGGAVADPKQRPVGAAVDSYNRRLVAVLPEEHRPAQRLMFQQLGQAGTLDTSTETMTLGAYQSVRVDIET
ncbi:MAG: hypothetical protein KDA24_00050 [Deltaproteobacteria bacterium]|nr:hypothetical protein [Deltaproteobacteria bacterium]